MLASPLTRIVTCFLIGILLVFGIAAIGSLSWSVKLILLVGLLAACVLWYLNAQRQPEPQSGQAQVASVPLTRYDAPVFVRRGWVLWERGDDQAAIAAFEQAIQLNPDLATAYLGRGWEYILLGERSAAIADCQRAMQLPIQEPMAFYQRGHLRYDLGDVAGAQADFAQSIALETENPDRVIGETATDYYLRGLAHYRLDDRAVALVDLEVAARLSESTPESRVHRQVMDLIQQIQP
ncbi:tetratricopeptide repeat protein [Pantanalinema rosaneae CENA516]|uniref:tetratricopeptide repeat protein n=1 Tax=Pantanalinema rosaneae TaxID=1620701 RepID=UPI003D6E4A69